MSSQELQTGAASKQHPRHDKPLYDPAVLPANAPPRQMAEAFANGVVVLKPGKGLGGRLVSKILILQDKLIIQLDSMPEMSDADREKLTTRDPMYGINEKPGDHTDNLDAKFTVADCPEGVRRTPALCAFVKNFDKFRLLCVELAAVLLEKLRSAGVVPHHGAESVSANPMLRGLFYQLPTPEAPAGHMKVHTDIGYFTFAFERPGDRGALEVFHQGVFKTVVRVPGTILVMAGLALELVSEGAIRAMHHQVPAIVAGNISPESWHHKGRIALIVFTGPTDETEVQVARGMDGGWEAIKELAPAEGSECVYKVYTWKHVIGVFMARFLRRK